MIDELPGFAVTVVIPLYNKAPFIRATIQSALDQTLPPTEVIVVDDQSTDEGPALVRGMGDPRIRLIAQPNAGPGPARNRGVGAAETPWVAFLDGDDLWRPGHLAALARLARRFRAAEGLTTTFERCAPGSPPPPAPRGDPNDRLLDYFAEAQAGEPMWTSCVAMRRDAFQTAGGFGAIQPGEDFEFWARFALDHPIAATNERTALYMLDDQGLMGQAQRVRTSTPTLQPIFATLQTALDDPRRADKHGAISAYRTHLLKMFMRHALYRANTREARYYARLLSAIGGARAPLPLRLLALLSDPLLRAGMRVRNCLLQRTSQARDC